MAAKSLRDISGASIWDTSETTNMASVFECDSVLSDIYPVMNWNTSKVTSMSRMFGCNVPITNTIALETKQRDGNDYVSWDVSNVKDMSSMFYNALSLSDITHLASWNTASLEDASGMFSGYYGGSVPLENTYPIRTNKYDMYDYTSWDMSHVKSIANMFAYTYISDISSLATWNTSSLESISGLFSHARLADLTPLAGWNTSNVNTFYKTFEYNSSLTSTAPLINWDSSNVETMALMFDGCRSLSDLSGLANWNTSKVTNMFSMFGYTSLANASMEALRTIQRDGNNYTSWDVSHVLTMDRIFEYSGITDIEPLESWDVQSSTTMKYAFTGSARPGWYHE